MKLAEADQAIRLTLGWHAVPEIMLPPYCMSLVGAMGKKVNSPMK
jgi:hypothetical protein